MMLSYKIEHLHLTVLVFFLAWIFFWFLLCLSGFSFLSQSYLYIRVFPSGNLYSESSVLAVVFSLFPCFRIVLLLHLTRRQTIYTTLPSFSLAALIWLLSIWFSWLFHFFALASHQHTSHDVRTHCISTLKKTFHHIFPSLSHPIIFFFNTRLSHIFCILLIP